jgi:hypothetical protein
MSDPMFFLWPPDPTNDARRRPLQHVYAPLAYSLLFLLWRFNSVRTLTMTSLVCYCALLSLAADPNSNPNPNPNSNPHPDPNPDPDPNRNPDPNSTPTRCARSSRAVTPPSSDMRVASSHCTTHGCSCACRPPWLWVTRCSPGW